MSERLPYEEQLAQQWNDLPLPDENAAWADMKKRLEEDDDDRLIPVWLRGCAFWGLIGVLLLGLGWWILRPEKWFEKKKDAPQKELVIENQPKQKQSDQPLPAEPQKANPITPGSSTPGIDQNETTEKLVDLDRSTSKPPGKQKVIEKKIKKHNVTGYKPLREVMLPDNKNPEKKIVIANPLKEDSLKDQNQITIIDQPGNPEKNIVVNKSDTTSRMQTDSLQQKKITETVKTTDVKKDSAKRKQVSFAAGIAMNQQIPMSGQKFTPYNAEGRMGSISDYIPSVYLRMYKKDKWFIQSEFRYGAPQYSKAILYNQKIQSDTFNQTTTTSSMQLKKTFYHQLPISFNYFITRDWSLGAGVVWNKFESAVSSQDIIRHNNQTGIDSTIVKGRIITTKQLDSMGMKPTDTNFVKSYFQGIFETQYRWKRFSVGIRYAFGLQPYLRFKLPGGVQQQERNNSLNLFLRYELWRSKK